jgi:hypothetical protein
MSHKSKSHARKPQTNAHQHSTNDNERNIRGDIHVRGEIETNFPPYFVKQHDTERKEDTAQAKKNYVVQIVIAIAVAVYAFLTFWQGWLLRKSINNNTEQFRIDQRPYIWVGKLIAEPEFMYPRTPGLKPLCSTVPKRRHKCLLFHGSGYSNVGTAISQSSAQTRD